MRFGKEKGVAMTIELEADFMKDINELIRSGDFKDVKEVLAAGIMALKRRERKKLEDCEDFEVLSPEEEEEIRREIELAKQGKRIRLSECPSHQRTMQRFYERPIEEQEEILRELRQEMYEEDMCATK